MKKNFWKDKSTRSEFCATPSPTRHSQESYFCARDVEGALMRRTFIDKLSRSKSVQSNEDLKQELTISARFPPLMTGSSCLSKNKM